MEYKGFNFYRQREVIETDTTYFICARYRSGCRARLIVSNDDVKARNSHSCDDEEETTSVTDVRSRMRTELQKAGLANLSLPPSLVWEQVMASLQATHPADTLRTIRFERSIITEIGNKTKWDAFWRYFRSTWMKSYGADLWNVNSMVKAGVDVHNRTKNPLESYNRVFGEKFTVKHPSLVGFVEIAKEDAQRFVRLIDDVKNHRREPPPHAPCVEPVIPPDYVEFE